MNDAPRRLHSADANGSFVSPFGPARKPRKWLLVAVVAWAVFIPGATFNKGAIRVDVHVTLEVQGEAGVRVGPG